MMQMSRAIRQREHTLLAREHRQRGRIRGRDSSKRDFPNFDFCIVKEISGRGITGLILLVIERGGRGKRTSRAGHAHLVRTHLETTRRDHVRARRTRVQQHAVFESVHCL